MSRPSFRSGLSFLWLLSVHHFTVHCHPLCKSARDGLQATPHLSLRSISVNPPQLTMISTDLIFYQMSSSSLNTTTNQLHLVDVQSESLLSKWPILQGRNLQSAYSIFTLTISKNLYLFILFGTESKEHKNDRIFDLMSGTVIDGIRYDKAIRSPIWVNSSTGRLYLLYPSEDGSLMMQQMVRPQSVTPPFMFHIYKAFRILCYNSNDASLRLIDTRGLDRCTSESDQFAKWNIGYGFAINGVFYLFAKNNKQAYRFNESTYDTMTPVPMTNISLETFFICPKIDGTTANDNDDSTTDRSVLVNDITKMSTVDKVQVIFLWIFIICFLLLIIPLLILLLFSICNCQRKCLPTRNTILLSTFHRSSGSLKARGRIRSVQTVISSAATKHNMKMVTKTSGSSVHLGGGSKVGSQLKAIKTRGSKLKRKSNRYTSSRKVPSDGSKVKLVVSSKQRTYQGMREKQGKPKITTKGSGGTDAVHFSPLTGSQTRVKKATNQNPCSAGGSPLKATGSQRRIQSAHKRLSRKPTHTRIHKKCT